MYKKIVIMFLVIAFFTIIQYKTNNNDNAKSIPKNIEKSINYFNNNIVTNVVQFNKCLNDRYVMITSDGFSIGENKNELENGYYDVNVRIKETNIELYINKLFKEFDKDVICDEIYVSEITDYIMELLNLEIDKTYFCKLIITNYMMIRDIDRNSVQSVDKTTSISDINIFVTMDENILVMKLGDV